MDETKQNKVERWQNRLERVGEAQARYLTLLMTLALFYLALLVSQPTADADSPIAGLRMPRPVLFALGPLAIWLTILAAYGTMRMAAFGKLRLKVLKRYVPSAFMDIPTFIDAVVFTPPAPWGLPLERRIARFSYPLALTIPWIEGLVLAWLGYRRGYFSLPGVTVALLYAPPMLWSLRCVLRLWSSRLEPRGRRVSRRMAI